MEETNQTNNAANNENSDLDAELEEVNIANAGTGIDPDNPLDPKVELTDEQKQANIDAGKNEDGTEKTDTGTDDDEETEEEKKEREKKEKGDTNEAEGLNRDGTEKEVELTDEQKQANIDAGKNEDGTEKTSTDDGDDGDDGDDDTNKTSKRPEKYIPLKKYHDTKRELTEAKDKIVELQTAAAGGDNADVGKPVPSKDRAAKIKAWAEKHNFSEEAATELVDLIGTNDSGITKKDVDTFRSMQDKQNTDADIAHFDTEFTDIAIPQFKKDYPDATADQIKKAKVLLDQIAHTKDYYNTKLGYVIFDNKKELDKIMTAATTRKGPDGEGSKKTASAPNAGGFDASKVVKDKDTGRYDFSSVDKIPEGEEREAAISALDPEAWSAYVDQMDDEMVISRGGRKISLK